MSLSKLSHIARRLKRRSDLLRRRIAHPIRQQQLESSLEHVLGSRPERLLVHCSLSSCGYVLSGPEGIIGALKRRCGTLCLPTNTYCYGQNGASGTFFQGETPSRNGRITDVFWRMDRVQRSLHPTHSVAADGPLANELCRDHIHCQTACGPGTPYERLRLNDAAVLMFGTTMNTYSLFHHAEDAAASPYLYEQKDYDLKAVDTTGKVHAVRVRRQDMSVPRRFTAMRDELLGHGLLEAVPFGCGELLFIPSSARVHEYLLRRLRDDAYHLVDKSACQSVTGAECPLTKA